MVACASTRIFPLALALIAVMAFGCSGSEAGGDGGTGAVGGDGGSGGAAGSGGAGGAGGGGTGGEGGTAGTGGTGAAVGTLCTMDVDCNDDQDCTQDTCDRAGGSCSHQNVRDGTLCDVDVRPGLCASGLCVSMPCEFDCNDDDDCTRDLCLEPAGCFNLPEMDGTACDANGTPGTCQEGLCEAPP